jgi:hypothetical protein
MGVKGGFRGAVASMVVTACLFPLMTYAQTAGSKPRTDAGAKPAAQGAAQTVAPGVMVTQAFTQRGVAKCADRIGQFAQFLTNGAEVGGQVFVAPDDPDRRLSSASLEIQAGPAMGYAGLTFAPDAGANRCGGMYELVTYWPNSCEEVATKAYPTYKRTNALRKAIMALDGGPTVRVFLMPAGVGCVSIKKELTY